MSMWNDVFQTYLDVHRQGASGTESRSVAPANPRGRVVIMVVGLHSLGSAAARVDGRLNEVLAQQFGDEIAEMFKQILNETEEGA